MKNQPRPEQPRPGRAREERGVLPCGLGARLGSPRCVGGTLRPGPCVPRALRRPQGVVAGAQRSGAGAEGTAGPAAPLSPPTRGRPRRRPPRRERAAARPAAVVERPQGAGRSGRRGAAFPPARPPLRGRSLRRRNGGAGSPGGREEVSGAGAGAGGGPIPAGRLLSPAVPAVAPRGLLAAPRRGGGLPPRPPLSPGRLWRARRCRAPPASERIGQRGGVRPGRRERRPGARRWRGAGVPAPAAAGPGSAAPALPGGAEAAVAATGRAAGPPLVTRAVLSLQLEMPGRTWAPPSSSGVGTRSAPPPASLPRGHRPSPGVRAAPRRSPHPVSSRPSGG